MTGDTHRDRWLARLARLKRPWCWLTSHDWVILEQETEIVTIHHATCLRCGDEREMVNRWPIGKEFPEGELYD